MAKKLISVKPNILIDIARKQGVQTLNALSERTRVDRKTLKTINEGKAVKEATLISIADKLRVPLTYFTASDEPSTPATVDRRPSELNLKVLTAQSLRLMLSEASNSDAIIWRTNLNAVDDEVESCLLKFEETIAEFAALLNGWDHWRGKNNELKAQLSKLKMQGQIETHIQSLSGLHVRLFGGTFVRWEQNCDCPPGIPDHLHRCSKIENHYWSTTAAVIGVEEGKSTSCRVQVDQGEVPPRSFEKCPEEISRVFIDGELVWSRTLRDMDDEIPF